MVKSLPDNAGDLRNTGLILGSGRSPGGGNGDTLQYFCLGNPRGRKAWWTTVYGVAESNTVVAFSKGKSYHIKPLYL